MDIKKMPYEIAFQERQRSLENQIYSEHRHEKPIESPQDEIKPSKGSEQLGEGAQ